MERHAFALKIKEGEFTAFRSSLKEIWPDLTKLLDLVEAANFSLWNIGEELVFGYYETAAARRNLTEDEMSVYRRLMDTVGTTCKWISRPGEEMRLMYQDFGIVRENKEQIRHRVFATHLKGEYQEEYKRRHDALAEARGDHVTEGPDSNFSIWNAGRYIFGYDEIDVTMEQAETQESRQAAIDWETKMLEIMEWFTDDVDWITGERHPHVVRIGYYN